MSIPGSTNPLLLFGDPTGGQYQIQRSLRFNSSDSGFCSRTPAVAGNRKTYTFSCWVKRSKLGTLQYVIQAYGGGTYRASLFFDTDDTLYFALGNTSPAIRTNAVFRDVSAWYHIVLAIDTTQSTQSAGMKLYVNGTQQTVTNSGTYTQNDEGWINSTSAHQISGTSGYYLDGYLADIYFLDGQALTPSSFTEVSATTGQLIPKAYTGSYTGNSFWLKFSDNSAATATTLGKDSFLLGNNWTPNNLSVTAGAGNDSLVDTPTSYGTDTYVGGEVRGNYATLNPLDRSSNVTLANGNLDWSNSSAGNVRGTVSFNGGKFYCEATASTAGSYGFGIGKASSSLSGNFGAGITGVYAWRWDGVVYKFHSSGSEPWSASGSSSDVLQIAIDASNSASVKLFLGRQNTWYDSSGGTTANPATGANPTATLTDNVDWFLFTGGGNISNAVSVNMGARLFAYTAPSGFKALCDTNLPAPVVAKPNTVMDVKLYTGNGAANTITGLAFSPDLVWMKVRSTAYNHTLIDSVRGATKTLSSSMTVQEYTEPTGPTAFTADGWSMSGDVTYVGSVNASGQTYVGWAWDAGTSTDPSNQAGSITSQVRANASAGFSIVTYQANAPNNTIGHGLGVRPEFVITKARTRNDNWLVYHSALGVDKWLHLNITAAAITTSGIWGTSGNWTSTTFGVSTNGIEGNNYGSNNFVAYCFAPVAGYSSFGSYTGNGSADGPFVFCGFRPRWVLIKNTTGSNNWELYDAARDPNNVVGKVLLPNTSDAEITNAGATPGVRYDFLSNGFKLRDSQGSVNGSGNTIIFAAFAESPFQYARAR